MKLATAQIRRHRSGAEDYVLNSRPEVPIATWYPATQQLDLLERFTVSPEEAREFAGWLFSKTNASRN